MIPSDVIALSFTVKVWIGKRRQHLSTFCQYGNVSYISLVHLKHKSVDVIRKGSPWGGLRLSGGSRVMSMKPSSTPPPPLPSTSWIPPPWSFPPLQPGQLSLVLGLRGVAGQCPSLDLTICLEKWARHWCFWFLCIKFPLIFLLESYELWNNYFHMRCVLDALVSKKFCACAARFLFKLCKKMPKFGKPKVSSTITIWKLIIWCQT